MRLLVLLLLYVYSAALFSQCTKEQKEADIEIKINTATESIKAGGDHGYMDKVIIHAPVEVAGIPLTKMQLTAGEVESFYIPVAYEIEGGLARAEIIGYKDSIDDFELAIYYENSQCQKSIQFFVWGIGLSEN